MRHEDVCILFDSHGTTEFISTNFERYRRAAEGICPIYLCNDAGIDDAPDVSGPVINLSREEIFGAFDHRKGDHVIPGNPDLKLLAATRQLPRFNRFIRIEFDVLPLGAPQDSVRRLAEIAGKADLAASYVGPYASESKWGWWESLSPPDSPDIDVDDVKSRRVKGFFPISTFSRDFLNIYESYLRRGWTGHYEVLLPTVANLEGRRTVSLSSPDHKITNRMAFSTRTPHPDDIPKGVHFAHKVKDEELARAILGEAAGPVNFARRRGPSRRTKRTAEPAAETGQPAVSRQETTAKAEAVAPASTEQPVRARKGLRSRVRKRLRSWAKKGLRLSTSLFASKPKGEAVLPVLAVAAGEATAAPDEAEAGSRKEARARRAARRAARENRPRPTTALPAESDPTPEAGESEASKVAIWSTKGPHFWAFLSALLIKTRPRSMLELGTGRSTTFLADYAFRSRVRFIAVEENEVWHRKVTTDLRFMRNGGNYVHHVPVVPNGEDRPWYDMQLMQQLLGKIRFDLVFVDGPQGAGRLNRDGQELIATAAKNARLVMVDDVHRSYNLEFFKELSARFPEDGRFYYSYNRNVFAIATNECRDAVRSCFEFLELPYTSTLSDDAMQEDEDE